MPFDSPKTHISGRMDSRTTQTREKRKMICGPVGLVGFGWRILDSSQTDISGRGSFRVKRNEKHGYCFNFKELFTLLDLCVSSLRRGHAYLLCIVPMLTDDPRGESELKYRRKDVSGEVSSKVLLGNE